MKRILISWLAGVSCLILAGCSGGQVANESETEEAADEATVIVDNPDGANAASNEAELPRASHNEPADGTTGRPRPEEDPAIGSNPEMDALEGKCFAEVEKVTGASVTATLSKDFSQAGTMFKFRVEGAQAPWQCIGYSNGTVGGVMYTGDEGAM